MSAVQRFAALVLLPLLTGCGLLHASAIDPQGPIAIAQRHLLLLTLGLMLIVVVPVWGLTAWSVWRYRASRQGEDYRPEWKYSLAIDVTVWAVPAVIVLAIGVNVWRYTHRLDPWRPIGMAPPLRVDVIALDWKFLFLYPDQHIATVNQLVFPADRPAALRMTSDTVMVSFDVPGLAGQVFAMAGMRTRLHLIANTAGTFTGRNVQYAGSGFPGQTFTVTTLSREAFDSFVARARQAPPLDEAGFARLEKPAEDVPPALFGGYPDDLFHGVIGKFGHRMAGGD